ncbi:citrate/2-methylcitrate synthase [Bradyrhizobium sp. NAS96.2]|uniref:citrate/2-methylcitrate synthase n=1 Tax=Bradyrhizobium sp. NAS96.2 TaxID=1680160 RepID=UPI00093C7B4A|nr:citrate/2-methylcitrate synthase [Bradyrhizobium sp. NAS96.2]OKO80882.1 hypothetical protein AC628_08150 [Bradyrhizobium sp. NAS96.2]
MPLEYWTAKQSADFLGIRPASLYAYVSRKGIRSVAVPGTREHRYLRSDIEGVRKRKGRTVPSDDGMELKSAITLITEDGPYYRGQSASKLAHSATIETVAALLWDVDEAVFDEEPPAADPAIAELNRHLVGAPAMHRALALFPFLEESTPRAFDLSREGMALTGTHIMRWLAAIMLRQSAARSEPIHAQFGKALNLNERLSELLRRLLVLSADHGFEEATYAVRYVASTGVTPWRIVATGLSVTTGRASKFGRNDAVRRLLAEIVASRDGTQPVLERIKGNEDIPGFASVVYPKGDPRARALLDHCDEVMAGDKEYKMLKRALQTANEYKGLQPNFALATLFADMKFRSARKSRTQNADFSETPFIVGRTAGWIAHAIEQYALGETGRRTVDYRGLLPMPA